MKKRYALLAAILAAAVIGGCDSGVSSGSDPGSESYADSYNTSTLPFEIPTGTPTPDTPYLKYLGSLELSGTDAASLYINNYTDGNAADIIEWEYVTPQNLPSRLSELISADLSPDLCDKLDQSYPYLISKNLYEDLTAYIDLTAPQWADYAEHIDGFSVGGARYFYPTRVTVSPNVLLYNRRLLLESGLDDPSELWKRGEWTRGALSRILETAPGIGGSYVLENFLAGSGISLITSDSSSFALRLNDGIFLKNAAFVNENYFDTSGADSAFVLPNNEYCSFVSVSDGYLAELRRAYPEEDFGIVPFPLDEDADAPAYLAVSEGFLVPKRAKNIKGAASFINCSRIVAKNSGIVLPSGLSDEDIDLLTALRSNKNAAAVLMPEYCLDNSSNKTVNSLMYEIYSSNDLSEDWERILREYGTPLSKAVAEINEGLD